MNIVEFTTQSGNHYLKSYNLKTILLLHPAFNLCNTDLQNKFSLAEIEHQKSKYQYLKKCGVYKSIRLRDKLVSCIDSRKIDDSLPLLDHLCLELTEKCNLKCKYCVYEGMYDGINKRSNKVIDFRIIKKLLDYFANLFTKENRTKKFVISFYGGEPLLEPKIIEDTINYIEQINFNKLKVKYILVTNGVLLKKHIDFLVKYDFSVKVSLDGNYQHNQHRVLRKSGKQSFWIIKRNLDYIKSKYGLFFENNIEFNSVYHNLSNLDEVYEFFRMEFQKTPRIGNIAYENISEHQKVKFNEMKADLYYDRKSSKHYNDFEKEESKMSDLDSAKEFAKVNYLTHTFYDKLEYLNKYKAKFVPTSTCLPFKYKIFVTTGGEILPCEKVPHIHTIGKITKSEIVIRNYDIAEYVNSLYDKVIKQCYSCYKYDHCSVCLFLELDINKCRYYMNKEDERVWLGENLDYFELNPKNYKKISRSVLIK